VAEAFFVQFTQEKNAQSSKKMKSCDEIVNSKKSLPFFEKVCYNVPSLF
jgi:hypothetical protein